MRKNRAWPVGLVLVASVMLCALLAPILAPQSPTEQVLAEGLKGPSREHLFGQDRLGRDVLSRTLYGARVSIWVATVAISISLGIGLFVGLMAGHFGGWMDELLMRLVDILQAFPGILLAIAFAAILGPSITNVVIALSLISWVGYARLTRGQILVVRHSYRPGSSLPGGEVKKDEEPAAAASRELREEVGIQVEPKSLISVHEGRSGEVLFELHPPARPALKIDNFEIIGARFFDPVDIADPDYNLSVYLRQTMGTVRKSVV